MEAGAEAIFIGRNVFQAPDPRRVLRKPNRNCSWEGNAGPSR